MSLSPDVQEKVPEEVSGLGEVLPLGLTSATATFERLMESIFKKFAVEITFSISR